MTIISRQLQRFRVEEFKIVLKDWSALRKLQGWNPVESPKILTDVLKKSTGKRKFIAYVNRLANNKAMTSKQIAELDLVYIMTYPKKKKWSTIRLEPREDKPLGICSDPCQLQKMLEDELGKCRLKVSVLVRLRDGMLWTCIHIDDGRKGYYPPHTTFLVHCPRTDSLCICGGNLKQRKFIYQSLMKVFKCSDVEALKLEGNCVKSLLSLALRRPMPEETESELRSKVASQKSKKRKLSDWDKLEDDDELVKDERIICENAAEKQLCKDYVIKTFGEGRLPTLETLTYETRTNFHASKDAPAMPTDELFECRLTIKGPSVIAGLRQLALAGVADLPMKSNLAKVTSLARNKFVLQQKNLNQRSASK